MIFRVSTKRVTANFPHNKPVHKLGESFCNRSPYGGTRSLTRTVTTAVGQEAALGEMDHLACFEHRPQIVRKSGDKREVQV